MWIVASIPFWLTAIAVFCLGIVCICMSFDDKFLRKQGISEVSSVGYCCFGFMCIPTSGLFALMAAKIAS